MENKKDDTLGGLAKAFAYGLPYRPMLSPDEQVIIETRAGNELAKTQGDKLSNLADAQNAGNAHAGRLVAETQQTRQSIDAQTNQLVIENKQTRQAVETQTEALSREIADSQMYTREQLARMTAAFQEGSNYQIEATREASDETMGISSDRKSLSTLISTGEIDETEAIALVLKRIIPTDIGINEVLRNLDPWKLQMLRSGIVRNPNLKIEETLSSEERQFLTKMRRTLYIPPIQMQALPVVAQNRHIVPKIHHQLMEKVKTSRHGIEGIQYGVRDLDDKLDIGNRQREKIGYLQQLGTQYLANISETGQEMVHLTRDGNNRLAQIDSHTGQTADNTAIIAKLMEIAGIERASIRRNSDDLLRNSNIALSQRGDIRTATMETADNTASLLALQKLFGEEVIDRMDEAQSTRLNHLAVAITGVGLQKAQLDMLGNMGNTLENIAELGGEAVSLLADLRNVSGDLVNLALSMDRTLTGIDNELGGMHRTLKAIALIFNQKSTEIVRAIDSSKSAFLSVANEQKDRDLNPEKIRANESLKNGIKLFEAGKIEKAVPYFDDAEKRDPTNFETYYRRAICYIILEMPDKAEKDLLDSLDFATDTDVEIKNKITMTLAQLYYAKATVYAQRGEPDDRDFNMLKAIEVTEALTKEDPSNTEAAFSLAKYLAAHQMLEEATRKLIILLEKHPNYSEKIQAEPEFTPILPKLKEVLKSELKSQEEFYCRLAVDYIRENDIQSGLALIEKLLSTSPQTLTQEKIWDKEELNPVKQRIIENIIKFIEGEGKLAESQYWFNVSYLGLKYGISRGIIIKALKKGIGEIRNEDDIKNIRNKLKKATQNDCELLIALIKRHSSIPTIIRNTL